MRINLERDENWRGRVTERAGQRRFAGSWRAENDDVVCFFM
jgi:hypothetical protein